MRPSLTAACLLVATVLASRARAQESVDAPRVAGYLALAVGGDADFDSDPGGSTSSSLDATIGFGVRGELPVHQFVVLAASFELMTFETNGSFSSAREEVLNFDAWIRGRYPFELTRDLWLEPYVAVPIGFSLGLIPVGGEDEAWPGWNVGVLGGAALILGNLPLAFFFELGWRFHQVFYDQNVPILGNIDYKLTTNQLAMQGGAALHF
ncbi:MAG: hypothetical protein AB7S26_11795 [Sandaracinaceae bacterium]